MFRRYNRWHSRFDQPDPYEGSYDLTNPQTFNRYSYVSNDPVNFVDPTGLMMNCSSTFGWDPEAGSRWDPGSLVVTGTICYGVADDWYNGPRHEGAEGPNGTVVGLVNQTLSNKDCQDFLKTALNNASAKDNPVLHGGDIRKIFADFLAQKKDGISREQLTKYGTATGKIGTGGKGNGTLHLPLYSGTNINQDWIDASGVVNELPHIAGSKGGVPDHNDYDDYALAQAVHNSKYGAYSRFTGDRNPFTAGVTNRLDQRWSSYFHDILRQHCIVPQAR
jgi:hypothetical protein